MWPKPLVRDDGTWREPSLTWAGQHIINLWEAQEVARARRSCPDDNPRNPHWSRNWKWSVWREHKTPIDSSTPRIRSFGHSVTLYCSSLLSIQHQSCWIHSVATVLGRMSSDQPYEKDPRQRVHELLPQSCRERGEGGWLAFKVRPNKQIVW